MLLAKSESFASATAASTLGSAIDPQLIRIVILRDAVLSELCRMSAAAIAASSKSRRPAVDDGGQSRCDMIDHFLLVVGKRTLIATGSIIAMRGAEMLAGS